jgi:hypothetical protein
LVDTVLRFYFPQTNINKPEAAEAQIQCKSFGSSFKQLLSAIVGPGSQLEITKKLK